MPSKSLDEMRDYLHEVTEELLGLREIDNLEMYRALTGYGSALPGIDDSERVESNFVHGCISNVYVVAELRDGAVHYRGSSESHVVRGYLAVLVAALSGLSPADVVRSSREAVEAFARDTDIKATLTPNRANAFGNIYKLMVEKAAALVAR